MYTIKIFLSPAKDQVKYLLRAEHILFYHSNTLRGKEAMIQVSKCSDEEA
jgi:hypothetical protein